MAHSLFNTTAVKYKTSFTSIHEPALRCHEAMAGVHWHGQYSQMELSHRDQMESSAAVGLQPANTQCPLTFHCHVILSLYCKWKEKLVLFAQVLRLQKVIQNVKTIQAHIPSCLLVLFTVLYSPLPFHARRPICASLCLSRMFTQPYTQSHHSVLTPGCCLALFHHRLSRPSLCSWRSVAPQQVKGKQR